MAILLQETEAHAVTPVQYAALQAVGEMQGIDQRTRARTIALGPSTVAGVIDRLESRRLLQRSASPEDRRVRRLSLTPQRSCVLEQLPPPDTQPTQQRMREPLPRVERDEFMRRLQALVTAHNELSRAPSDGSVRTGHGLRWSGEPRAGRRDADLETRFWRGYSGDAHPDPRNWNH